MKCKHEWGWFVIRDVPVYVFPNGAVVFGFNRHGERAKFLARCNNPECQAVRNVYIGQKFGVGLGKIRQAKKGEIEAGR